MSIKKLTKRQKIITIGAILIAIYLVIRVFYGHKGAVQYITMPAKMGNIEVNVLADGVVKPQNLVAIGAQTSGKILALKVAPGDKVVKGQLIARIDSVNQENDLKKAQQALNLYKAKLAEQKIQAKLSAQKLERSTQLLKSNAIGRSSYENDQAQLLINKSEIAVLQAEIAQANIDVETAKSALSYTEVRAPDSGTILATLVQEGQNINAVQSVPIVAILGNVQRMKIYAQISEADIGKVKTGQEVYFNVVGNVNKIYHAHLETIDPAPESIRDDINFNASFRTGNSAAIYYNACFSVDNSDNSLRTYMTCEVHIILGKATNVLLVPSSALHNIKGENAQLTVKQYGALVTKSVKLGLNNKVMAQIKQGLAPGEEVVISNKAL